MYTCCSQLIFYTMVELNPRIWGFLIMSEAVLTYPNSYYTENFSRKTKILTEYKLNMLTFLKQTCPEKSEQELIALIDKTVKDKMLNYLTEESDKQNKKEKEINSTFADKI